MAAKKKPAAKKCPGCGMPEAMCKCGSKKKAGKAKGKY